MKKCPKCGTILDDSKQSCYMCGTSLSNSNSLNFGDTFNKQIGATMTNSQGNVFGNKQIKTPMNAVGRNSNNAKFSQNGSMPASFFQNQLSNNSRNQFDNRTALEKSFTSDNRYQNNQNINKPMSNSNSANFSVSWNSQNTNYNQNSNKNKINSLPSQNTKRKKVNKTKEKNSNINWGDNLEGKENTGKFKLSLSFVFNTICLLLFIGTIILIYFKYIRNSDNKNVNLGGLVYTLDDRFVLKTDDKYSKYYTSGDDCAVRISYGQTNDIDSFVDEYFNQIREEYNESSGFVTQTQELKIKGNLWYELNVVDFQENPAASSGFSTLAKYRFVSMVYDGTYYDIRYVNLNTDSTCSAMYDYFINTLAIENKKE